MSTEYLTLLCSECTTEVGVLQTSEDNPLDVLESSVVISEDPNGAAGRVLCPDCSEGDDA